MFCQVLLIVFLFSICINISDSAQAFEKSISSIHGIVYYELKSENFQMCFRRLNATHQVGCSSQRAGSVGIVFHLKKHEDIKWLMHHSPQQNIIVVMSAKMFLSNVSDILIRSSKIAGIVVIVENERDRPDSFSPDLSCPSDHYGLYWSDEQYSNCRKTIWNPYGNGIMFMDIPFPLVVISNSSHVVEFILRSCFEKFNGQRDESDVSKCAMEIRDVMDGAKDTPTCMRRNQLSNVHSNQFYCDPLGNFNIFAYLNHVSKTEILDSKSVIVIAARLDSFSLFDDRYPGYESAALGFVTLHAVAEALGKIHHFVVLDASEIKPVIFALFHGEAFDYIGSSRMVYDIEHGKFLPLTLESIGTFIEVGQIGLNNYTDSLWIHTDPVSISKSPDVRTRVNSLASVMQSIGMDVGLSLKRPAQGSLLPPASLHQFLKSRKTSIAGVLLSSHEKEFSNRYYNSMFDNANFTGPETYDDITPTVQHIQKIATTVARTVFSLLFGNTSDIYNIHASNTTVANLLYCFVRNPDCELFNSTIEHGKADTLILLRSLYLSRYVGVVMSGPSFVVSQHQFLLAHFLGTAIDSITTAEACYGKKTDKDSYSYIFMNGRLNEKDGSRKPVCVRSTAFMSLALSPAFSISGYDWASELYSSWTESYWDSEAMSVRLFLRPSQSQEIITLCVGLVSLVISHMVVYLIHHKSSILFRFPEHAAQH